MPYSAGENHSDLLEFVNQREIKTVLDVGAGSGTYGKLLAPQGVVVDAVEVWSPYIDEFNLRGIYNSVTEQDAREVSPARFGRYDAVIFGDILEHMSRQDSLKVWANASSARYGVISVPIIHYPQGAEFNNPYEVHVQEHMHPHDIRSDYGPFVFDREYEVTGMFIKDFKP